MQTLTSLKSQINALEQKYARPLNSVKLLAVSKGQSSEKILQIYNEGQRAFGENYLQEALKKMPLLPEDIEWHFIGPIQSNKIKKIAEHFSWVQSVANISILERLNKERGEHLPPLNFCIQVNVDHEETKSGVLDEAELFRMANASRLLTRLHFRGLMCVPKEQDDMASTRASFAKLAKLFTQLNEKHFALDTLSMGMTHDLPAAIQEGATLVRIGRGLFGERKV